MYVDSIFLFEYENDYLKICGFSIGVISDMQSLKDSN